MDPALILIVGLTIITVVAVFPAQATDRIADAGCFAGVVLYVMAPAIFVIALAVAVAALLIR